MVVSKYLAGSLIMKWNAVAFLGMACSVCLLAGNEPKIGAPTMELERLYQPPKIMSVNQHEAYNEPGCQAIIFAGEPFNG